MWQFKKIFLCFSTLLILTITAFAEEPPSPNQDACEHKDCTNKKSCSITLNVKEKDLCYGENPDIQVVKNEGKGLTNTCDICKKSWIDCEIHTLSHKSGSPEILGPNDSTSYSIPGTYDVTYKYFCSECNDVTESTSIIIHDPLDFRIRCDNAPIPNMFGYKANFSALIKSSCRGKSFSYDWNVPLSGSSPTIKHVTTPTISFQPLYSPVAVELTLKETHGTKIHTKNATDFFSTYIPTYELEPIKTYDSPIIMIGSKQPVFSLNGQPSGRASVERSYRATYGIKVSTPDNLIINIEYEENHEFGLTQKQVIEWNDDCVRADKNKNGSVYVQAYIVIEYKDYELVRYVNGIRHGVVSTHPEVRFDGTLDFKFTDR
ncbi:hypothetical protein AAEX28_00130 [Lentisphaerota bacterium WC36G]|nr:hypothetical protein LJT99_03005 [Lentisphaerae bacterium WC36]